ncbi:MAG: peptidylprolyl isomerase [Nanoarchaeota archaeon]|nr:peptidylprolyl isomerase [Nanoarchaeota archaeon]
MTIKKGDKAAIDYEGKFETGEVFDSSTHGDHSHPLEFVVGAGEVIKGVDNAVLGMKLGDEKEIVIKPEEGYGMYDSNLKKQIPRDVLPQGEEPKVGAVLLLGTPDGHQFPVKIIEVNAQAVTIDLNHPLAGKILHFKIKIVNSVK